MPVNANGIAPRLFLLVAFSTGCRTGQQKPDCTPPKGETWFPMGGSEFAPLSHRVPTTFDWNGGWACGVGIAVGEQPSLAFGADGLPVVAHSGEGEIGMHVERFDGSSWASLDSSLGTLGLAWSSNPVWPGPQLVLDRQDRALVLWGEHYNGLYLRRYDGGTWNDFGDAGVGGIISPEYNLGGGSVALDVTGEPVVFYGAGSSPPSQVFARQLSAGAWQYFSGAGPPGGLSATADDSGYPSAASNMNGCLVVGWRASVAGVYVREYSSNVWLELAGSATGNGITGAGSGVLTPQISCDTHGLPVVAWRTNVPNTKSTSLRLYLMRFDGTAWAELAGSASGDGATGGPICGFSLALDRDDNPVIAWESGCASAADADQGTYEVYVKRYNGITWEGIGGSDTGGGVSNSENWLLYQSPSPSLAVSSNTICVAWSEFEPFYAKCDPYSGDLPTSYCYPNGTGHPRVIMRCAHY